MEAADEDNEHTTSNFLQIPTFKEPGISESPSPIELIEKKQKILFEGVDMRLTRLEESLAEI